MSARELLEQMAAMKAQFQNAKLFPFEQWLLDNGQEFGPVAKLDGLRRGPPKQCFSNATNAVLGFEVDNDEWFYTEGVVLLPSLPLTIDHAFLTNRKGEVLELTLEDPEGCQYFGVPFAPKALTEMVLENGYYGLFSNGVIYNKLLHQPVPDEVRAYPKEEKCD